MKSNCAVFSGDLTCMRAVAHQWVKPARKTSFITSRRPLFPLADSRGFPITFLFDLRVAIQTWPGGPLVWLLPERGPSLVETTHLLHFLSVNRPVLPGELWVLLCLPPDEARDEAERALDIVQDTLTWTISGGTTIRLEAVWLGGNGPESLHTWLQRLRRIDG